MFERTRGEVQGPLGEGFRAGGASCRASLTASTQIEKPPAGHEEVRRAEPI